MSAFSKPRVFCQECLKGELRDARWTVTRTFDTPPRDSAEHYERVTNAPICGRCIEARKQRIESEKRAARQKERWAYRRRERA